LETIVAGIPMDPADTDTTRPDAPAPAAAHEPSIAAGPCARALLDALPSAAYTCDADGCITYFNEQAAALWGQRPELGMPDLRFCGSFRLRLPDGSLLRHEDSPMARTLREGVGCRNQEVAIERPDGSVVDVLVNIDPLRDSTGRVVGAVNAFVDITDRRRTEQALRASEQRLHWALEGAGGGVWDWDLDAGAGWWSPEMYALCGVPPETPLGWDDFLQQVHAEDREALVGAVAAAIATQQDFSCELRIRHPELGERWMSSRGRVIAHGGRPRRLLGLTMDITERKAAEGMLAESVARFRRLADAMPQLVWTAEPDGTVDYYNDRYREYAGIERAADGAFDWQPVLHADDRKPTTDAWARAVGTGTTYECEHRIRMRNGSTRWHLSRAVPVRDDAGRIVKWFGTATDIHDVKRAQEALRDADQRKSEFVATLAHELRNPLAPIRNAIALLKLAEGLPDSAAAARDIIDRQSRHLVRLVDDLLDMSRVTRGRLQLKRERVRLEQIVAQMQEAMAAQIEARGQTLELLLPTEPIELDADPVRLTQVLVNLVDNASKYSDPGGHICVSARRDGDRVEIAVSDTGVGIAATELPKLFDMFAQVGEPSGRGATGLGIGLALTRRLVQMHGGNIEATSAGPGCGSTVTLRLPLAAAPSAPAEPTSASAPAPREDASADRGKPRVLIADDNQDVVESLAMLLELRGYDPITVSDGLQAVAAAEQQAPDIVLLDIGMPGLDGHTACRRIRELPEGRHLRIIALTGWGEARDRQRSREAGFDGHLVKPVEATTLLELLDQG
jgi:PAS domain S-box-containing protein